MKSLLFYSPAKLNLFFRVLRKRSDGYHEIASLFQAVDLFDRLTISSADQDQFTCSDLALPLDGRNLVVKAREIFRRFHPLPPLHLHLDKQIPMEAGLGGGSSNAATTLWAINQWMGRPFDRQFLQKMGSELGSDIAFFFSSGSAYCTGRGEIIEPFEPSIPLSGWIAKPDFGLSTPLVYSHVELDQCASISPESVLESHRQQQPLFFNDLELAAFRVEPRLSFFKKQLLEQGFNQVVMTGSGSSFFCLGTPLFLRERSAASKLSKIQFFPFVSLHKPPGLWYHPSS